MTQNSFHEVRFPTDLALGAVGGPVRRTEVITLGSGHEQRNARWVNSRRRYNAGYGIKTVSDIQKVIDFFEQRRGRLYGFRFRDPLDWSSAAGSSSVSPEDQVLGIGDGISRTYQLRKSYGIGQAKYVRAIHKPVMGTVKVRVAGNDVSADNFSLDISTGSLTFIDTFIPPPDAPVTAGFEFDVPVRFDSDEILINLSHFDAGEIPSIPLVELLR